MSSLAAGTAAGLSAQSSSNAVGAQPTTWRDRIREAAYTPPSGTRIVFDYQDVSREFSLRTAEFSFPNVDGDYVQQNGFGSRKYPLRCFFTGATCDLAATQFEAALLEKGVGKLEHPIYGVADKVGGSSAMRVVPFGDITRRDDLVTAANQVILEVTFWTTIETLFPSAQTDPQNEILAAVDAFNDAAANEFAQRANLKGALNQANAKGTFAKFLANTNSALTSASSSVASVRKDFAQQQAAINGGIDVLIGQPLLLAQQCLNLVETPARALTGIEARLAGYEALADSIFSSAAAAPGDLLQSGIALAVRTTKIATDFHIADLFAMAAAVGSLLSAAVSPFTAQDAAEEGAVFATKPQALTVADNVAAQFNTVVAWRDSGYAAVAAIQNASDATTDTGAAYQALQNIAQLTIAYLIQTSFSLLPERRIVLGKARTIVDLAAELYGSVDDRLDFLITSNNLTGSEILELPKGRSIVYYP